MPLPLVWHQLNYPNRKRKGKTGGIAGLADVASYDGELFQPKGRHKSRFDCAALRADDQAPSFPTAHGAGS